MSKKITRLNLAISILVLISMTCTCNYSMLPETLKQIIEEGNFSREDVDTNLEQSSPTEEMPTITVVEESYSENTDTLFSEFNNDPSASLLLQMLSADGYQSYVGSAYAEFDNGLVMRSLEVTNGSNNVLLAQFEVPGGDKEDMVLASPDDHTIEIWDETGGIRLMFQEDGSVDFYERDTIGNVLDGDNCREPDKVLTSMRMSSYNLCTTTGVGEFRKCLANNLIAFTTMAGCIIGAGVILGGTGGTGLPLAAVWVGAIAGCGMVASCIYDAASDNPPTAIIDGLEVVHDPYRTCRGNTLYTGMLYKIKVGCEDDRLPKPNLSNPDFEYITYLDPGEISEEGLCKDCSGQIGGSIIAPAWELEEKCEYGCSFISGNEARCLTKQEVENNQNNGESEGVKDDVGIAGTYEGEINFTAGSHFYKGELGLAFTNEMIITIDENGTVSGTLNYFETGALNKDPSYPNCGLTSDIDITGTIHGTDFTGDGTIIIDVTYKYSTVGTGECPYKSKGDTENIMLTPHVTISDNKIKNNTPEYFSFELPKK